MATHVCQCYPGQDGLTTQRNVINVPAFVVGPGRTGVDPGRQAWKLYGAHNTPIAAPHFHTDQSVLSFIYLGHGRIPFRYFSKTLETCPSGSRAETPRLKPVSPSDKSTAPGEIKANLPERNRPSVSRTSVEIKFVCQWKRSLARASPGYGRPSRGEMYSRNSTPGPEAARRAVIRRRAPKTLFRCSCSTP